MVVDPGGGQAGTLGGGCVEAEVKQKAIRQLGASRGDAQSFVLDHDYAWADGLICGGKMVILTEALRGPEPLAYFRAYQRLLEAGRGVHRGRRRRSRATSRARPSGSRFLFGPDGDAAGQAGPRDRSRTAWPSRSCRSPIGPGRRSRAGVAFLPTLPRIRLVIVGAGHVGQAVAEPGGPGRFRRLGVDDRSQYANRRAVSRRPQRILVGPIEEVLPSLEITPQHLRPDRDPRPRPRPGSALSPGPDAPLRTSA